MITVHPKVFHLGMRTWGSRQLLQLSISWTQLDAQHLMTESHRPCHEGAGSDTAMMAERASYKYCMKMLRQNIQFCNAQGATQHFQSYMILDPIRTDNPLSLLRQ